MKINIFTSFDLHSKGNIPLCVCPILHSEGFVKGQPKVGMPEMLGYINPIMEENEKIDQG